MSGSHLLISDDTSYFHNIHRSFIYTVVIQIAVKCFKIYWKRIKIEYFWVVLSFLIIFFHLFIYTVVIKTMIRCKKIYWKWNKLEYFWILQGFYFLNNLFVYLYRSDQNLRKIKINISNTVYIMICLGLYIILTFFIL